MYKALETKIEAVWAERVLLKETEYHSAVLETIAALDSGALRCAEPNDETPSAPWRVNEWTKRAILLYFQIQEVVPIVSGAFTYFDKIPLKNDFEKLGVRVVPPGAARYGSFLAPNVILMPAYVNIGAYVGSGSMVDTWATVGACAQVGKDVHLSGGVGLGGVLEPPQARPVVVEDGAFIGSRAIIVEGAHIGREAVIGAGVVITASSRIIDVSGSEPVEYKGYIPPRSVVIPGTFPKTFPAGVFHVPCALIIGTRSAETDRKTSLNDALRNFNVSI